jgi:hypothetical protein
MKTLFRFLTGIDLSVSVILYCGFVLITGVKFSWCALAVVMICAYLPDFDMLPYLFLKNKLRVRSHWLVGHHPIFVVPIALAIGYYSVGSIAVSFLCGLATFAHFVHDSDCEQGLHWLSPFVWWRFRVKGFWLHKLSRLEMYKFLKQSSWTKVGLSRQPKNAAEEFEKRTPPISVTQMVMFGFAILLFVLSKAIS